MLISLYIFYLNKNVKRKTIIGIYDADIANTPDSSDPFGTYSCVCL